MLCVRLTTLALGSVLFALPAGAQERRQTDATAAPPSIAERTKNLKKIDGFFPLYWDENAGRLFVEIPKLDTEVLYSTGLATGLGSNDIGLDRGMTTGSRIVKFERAGPRILMVQPNYQFRALTQNAAEAQNGPRRVRALGAVELPDRRGQRRPLPRRLHRVPGARLRTRWPDACTPGAVPVRGGPQQRLRARPRRLPEEHRDGSRADVRARGRRGAPGGRAAAVRGGRFFEGVGSVAATAEAASMRVHHSIVELPDPATSRASTIRAPATAPCRTRTTAALPGQPMTLRFIRAAPAAEEGPERRRSASR